MKKLLAVLIAWAFITPALAQNAGEVVSTQTTAITSSMLSESAHKSVEDAVQETEKTVEASESRETAEKK